ncbi:MAG: hypothetical protein Q8R79_03360 [Legionellaceae bacterium]|nr:hypothetical protein [Legionellaceae bacterium]
MSRVLMKIDDATLKVDPLGLVDHHETVSLEYHALCMYLSAKLEKQEIPDPNLLRAALRIATELQYFYTHYFPIYSESVRYEKEMLGLQHILKLSAASQKGAPVGLAPNEDYPKPAKYQLNVLSKKTYVVKNTTRELNYYRLLFNRAWRAFYRTMAALQLMLSEMNNFNMFVNMVDNVVLPCVNYLACVFFAPRLISNALLFIQHGIPAAWMGEEEKKIKTSNRLRLQLQWSWKEIANDVVSLPQNCISAVLLVGGLAPIAAYISAAGFFYDTLVASIAAAIEIQRLKNVYPEYKKRAENSKNPIDKALLTEIEALMAYEKKRLVLNVVSNLGIFIFTCVALPLLSVIPFNLLIAALCLLVFTLVMRVTINTLVKKPVSHIAAATEKYYLKETPLSPEIKIALEKKVEQRIEQLTHEEHRFFSPNKKRKAEKISGLNNLKKLLVTQDVSVQNVRNLLHDLQDKSKNPTITTGFFSTKTAKLLDGVEKQLPKPIQAPNSAG